VMALDRYQSDKIEIVLVGDGETRASMLTELYRTYIPNRIIALSSDGESALPLFEGRKIADGQVRAFVCRNSVCGLPASTVAELKERLTGI